MPFSVVGELDFRKAPLLLVGRLGNPHLFAASLHHAASVLVLECLR